MSGLRDGQQIRICHISGARDYALTSPNSSHSKRRRSLHPQSPLLDDAHPPLTPTTNVFSPITVQEGTKEWLEMRRKFSKRHVPDWAVARLPGGIGVSDKGIPKSGIEGVNWRVSGRRVGWAGRWKSDKMFCTLNDLSHAEALNSAAEWRVKHAESNACLAATSECNKSSISDCEDISPTEDSCRGRVSEGPGSRLTADSHNACCECDISGILRERSLVRGVALCKGSWKARWRDATGRQRMRTFGPTFTDREAAEKFIVAEREVVLTERKMLRDIKLEAPTDGPTSPTLPVATTTGDGFLPTSVDVTKTIMGFPSPNFENKTNHSVAADEWNQEVLASLIGDPS